MTYENDSASASTSPVSPLRLLIIGTDTGVGKSHVTATIVSALRQIGHQVWVHKPVACGDWDGEQAEDGRLYRQLCATDQDPDSACPWQFPEACSPHLAARLAGHTLTRAELLQGLKRCLRPDRDLVIEGAGGLLAPLSEDGCDIADLAAACAALTIIVTRPHLGTINHTRLTVAHARQRGLRLLGLVLNHHQPHLSGVAVEHAASELARWCDLPVIAELPYDCQLPAAAEGLTAHPLAQQLIASILRANPEVE